MLCQCSCCRCGWNIIFICNMRPIISFLNQSFFIPLISLFCSQRWIEYYMKLRCIHINTNTPRWAQEKLPTQMRIMTSWNNCFMFHIYALPHNINFILQGNLEVTKSLYFSLLSFRKIGSLLLWSVFTRKIEQTIIWFVRPIELTPIDGWTNSEKINHVCEVELGTWESSDIC